MKQILAECLNQTIRFKLKEGVGHTFAVSEVKAEYESYRKQLAYNSKYKIVEERIIGISCKVG